MLSGCGDDPHKITIYTSLPERDFQELITAFQTQHPDVKISFFRTGTTELITKLDAEYMADNPKADILLVSDDIVMTSLKDQGKLEPLSIDTTHLPKDSFDPDKMFFGTILAGTGLIYHKEYTPSSRSLHDLTSPEMFEKVVIPNPVYSGTSAVNLSIFAEHKDFGWNFWRAFLNNNPLLVKGNGAVLDTVAKKGRMCGIILDFMALKAIEDGAALDFFYFEEGSPLIRAPIALLKTSSHKKNALLFIEFILSKEGQQTLVNLGYRPIRTDVAPPKSFEKLGMPKEIPVDANIILNRIEQDRLEFSKAIH